MPPPVDIPFQATILSFRIVGRLSTASGPGRVRPACDRLPAPPSRDPATCGWHAGTARLGPPGGETTPHLRRPRPATAPRPASGDADQTPLATRGGMEVNIVLSTRQVNNPRINNCTERCAFYANRIAFRARCAIPFRRSPSGVPLQALGGGPLVKTRQNRRGLRRSGGRAFRCIARLFRTRGSAIQTARQQAGGQRPQGRGLHVRLMPLWRTLLSALHLGLAK